LEQELGTLPEHLSSPQICHVTDIEYEKKLNNIKENTTIEMMERPNPKLYRTTILM
jgi:hypothetical protein